MHSKKYLLMCPFRFHLFTHYYTCCLTVAGQQVMKAVALVLDTKFKKST